MFWGTTERDALASPFDEPWEKPVGFSEAWEASAAHGRAAKQIISRDAGRYAEWERLLEEVRAKTGERLPHPMAAGRGDLGEAQRRATLTRLARLRADRPELGLPEDVEAEIERRTDATLSGVVRQARAVEARPRTWGGLAGAMLGDVQTMITDPFQLPGLAMGAGVARGILATAAIEAGIGAGQSLAVSGLTARDRSRVDPDFGWREALLDAAGAGAGGAVIGGGVKALARLLSRSKGEDLPRSLRDAANAVESEGQIAATVPGRDVAAEIAHRAGLARTVDSLVQGEPVQPSLIPLGRSGRVFSSEGRAIDVQYELVDARELVTSHRDDLTVNPDFPAELQPRDRGRAGSAEQIAEIAARLEPERLGPSADAASGAPIIGPDNLVESGNARVLALRRAYRGDGAAAGRYRAWLEAQGFDPGDMTAPVLVARRSTALPPEERIAFTSAANRATAMRLSPMEQARADARLLDSGLLALVRPGEVTSAANREFVRGLLAKLPQAERAGLYDQGGALSVEGRRRIEAALMARAYGDPDLLGRALEATDNNVKAIAGSLNDVSAAWARMRDLARSGAISPHMDVTDDLLAAVRLVMRARDQDDKVADLAAQAGLFGDDLSPIARAFLHAFFRDETLRQPAGRAKVAQFLADYAEEAAKNTTDARLFGEPLAAGDILEGLRGRPDLVAQMTEAVAPERAAKTLASPEIGDATLQELDRLRAMGDIQVPAFEVDAATGEGKVVMKSVDEVLAGLDEEARAADLLQACAIGPRGSE